MDDRKSGSFTLPGEAGYEALTLALAKRWGADAIRDSDGTTLSTDILTAGFSIYATVCIIRQHNRWIAAASGLPPAVHPVHRAARMRRRNAFACL